MVGSIWMGNCICITADDQHDPLCSALSIAEKLRRVASLDLSKIIIAVDFDGTCVTHDFPMIGSDVPHASAVLKALRHAGAELILWTMRSDQGAVRDSPTEAAADAYLRHACEWFEARGIDIHGANINYGQAKWTSSPKAYAHIYIDDAALGCPVIEGDHERPYVDWDQVLTLLLTRFRSFTQPE